MVSMGASFYMYTQEKKYKVIGDKRVGA